jgi:hypothetical protein
LLGDVFEVLVVEKEYVIVDNHAIAPDLDRAGSRSRRTRSVIVATATLSALYYRTRCALGDRARALPRDRLHAQTSTVKPKSRRTKARFDLGLEEQLKNPEFAREFHSARAEIAAVDKASLDPKSLSAATGAFPRSIQDALPR